MSNTNPGKPRSNVRALAKVDMSGGATPPLAALAASSFGNGGGKLSATRPGRSVGTPLSSKSGILYSDATAAACASENPGPPGSARLRKASIWIEWQDAQTSL